MGSFVFKWEHPASEVYVTGTFDGWKKTERLDKIGDVFEKDVTLASATEKIYYKFVVDGNWVTDHTAPQENDESGNLNNVLTTDRIIKHEPKALAAISGVAPTSTTAQLAKDVPLEKDLPGAFPETPAAGENTERDPLNEIPQAKHNEKTEGEKSFGVSPLPAFPGAINPTKIAPGEKLPETSNLKSDTLTSNVRHDDPDLLAELKKSEEVKAKEEQTFGVSPLPAFPGAVNPIKLAPEEKVPDASTLTNDSITSGVRHDDPDLVAELKKSEQAKAKEEQTFSVSPLPAFAGAVNPIKLAPGEKVPDAGTLTDNTVQSTVHTDPETYEKGSGVQGGNGAFDLPPVSKNLIPESSLPISTLTPTIQSAGPNTTTSQLAGTVPLESSKVPAIVKDSQALANVEPEASGVDAEVKEKSEVERELKSKVPEVQPTSEGISTDTKTDNDVSTTVLPLTSKQTKLLEPDQTSVGHSNTEANGEDGLAKDTPLIVKQSIVESGQNPEAAANEDAVLEKKEVEKELLSEVKKDSSTGQPAPENNPSSKLAATQQGTESRDVSPGTIPGSRIQTNAETPAVASVSTPEKAKVDSSNAASPATASKTGDGQPASASQKKKNRASAFFSKIKSKLSDK